jgi:hypothetical protein
MLIYRYLYNKKNIMKQVILTESQFHTLIESQVIIESIFEVSSIREFKQEVRKLIRRMLLAGMSIAAIITMINNYCDSHNIPEETKAEVLSIVNEIPQAKAEVPTPTVSNEMPIVKDEMADWKLVDNKTIATVYNAVPAQCNGDFGHTASMFRLNLYDILPQRVIAMERTFMKKLGLKYGDVVYIKGTGKYDGVWQIQDTMNKRFAGQHKIDILVPDNIKYGQWDNVDLYVLKDKALTDEYKSKMAPQISEKELRRQVAQKKQEMQNKRRQRA